MNRHNNERRGQISLSLVEDACRIDWPYTNTHVQFPRSHPLSANNRPKSKNQKPPPPPPPKATTATKPNNSTGNANTNVGKKGQRRSNQGKDSANEEKTGGKAENARSSKNDINNNNNNNASGKKKKKTSGDKKNQSSSSHGKEGAKQKKNSNQNAINYAWSAFQSSPDPSALPDIGGLFLGGDDHVGKEGNDDGGEEGGMEPSSYIRTSLVNSMMAKSPLATGKGGGGTDAGADLLQRLTSPNINEGGGASATMPPSNNNKFRTAESLEAEMMSPSQEEGSSTGVNLMSALSGEGKKGEEEAKKIDEAKEDMPAADYNPPASMTKEEIPDDPISQLMNPGGYGMQQPQQHGMPYNHPLNYGPPPMQYNHHPHHALHGHHGPPFPMSPPQYHHPHHYHPYPPHHGLPPGYTVIQVRVPPVLMPGNMMIVNGMQIPVPENVPPGSVIPVTVPVPQQMHGHHPPPHPGNFHPQHHHHPGGYYPQHGPPPPPPPPMMNPNFQQQQMHVQSQYEHQQQQQNAPKAANSWAAKVASSPANDATKEAKEAPVKLDVAPVNTETHKGGEPNKTTESKGKEARPSSRGKRGSGKKNTGEKSGGGKEK